MKTTTTIKIDGIEYEIDVEIALNIGCLKKKTTGIKVGDWFEWTKYKTLCLLAITDCKARVIYVSLIAVGKGEANRFASPVPVKNPRDITAEEWHEITCGGEEDLSPVPVSLL